MATHEADGNSLSPSRAESLEPVAMQEKAHRGSSSSGSKHPRGHAKDRERESSKSRDRARDRGRYKDRDMDKENDRDQVRERDRDRDRERDMDKDKDREIEREKDRDRHHRDRHRDRSERRERTRDRDEDDDYYRSRDYDSKRMSGFDMAPAAMIPNTGAAVTGQLLGVTPTMTGTLPNMLPMPGTPFTNLSVMPVQAMTQQVLLHPMTRQATRHARRFYVGGLPPTANELSVASFFSCAMSAIGGSTGPRDAVVNVDINDENHFAFVEMGSVEEANNAMALDGIIFEGAPLRVNRPSDYNPSVADTLGPSQPNPNLNLAAVGLTPGSAGGLEGPGLEGPNRIFVGGLPYYFTESQIRELLESFGPLRGFDLVKDGETGISKGCAFCVYQDLSVTDIVCAALNGIKMGDKTLTVGHANQGTTQPKPKQESVSLYAQQIAIQMLAPNIAPAPATKVVRLTNVVTLDELTNDGDYEDILKNLRTECGKFGTLVNVIIPRPQPDGQHGPGVGKVFLEYADNESAGKARIGLHGREFGGDKVVAIFYPENKFSEGDYSG